MQYRGFAAGLIFVFAQQASGQTAAPPERVTVTDQALRDNPDGKGDPAIVICRKAQQMPGSRLMGPIVCKPNAEWAQIRADGNDVSPDGRQIVPSEKARALTGTTCLPSPPAGANGMAGRNPNSIC